MSEVNQKAAKDAVRLMRQRIAADLSGFCEELVQLEDRGVRVMGGKIMALEEEISSVGGSEGRALIHAEIRAQSVRRTVATSAEADPSRPVVIRASLAQADRISKALDLQSRICLGQLEEVVDQVRLGNLVPADAGRDIFDVTEDFRHQINQAKTTLGFTSSSSWGIGSPNVGTVGRSCFEMLKQINRALAMHRDPNPQFRGVDYDGAFVRYTQDPLLQVAITDHSGDGASVLAASRIEFKRIFEESIQILDRLRQSLKRDGAQASAELLERTKSAQASIRDLVQRL